MPGQNTGKEMHQPNRDNLERIPSATVNANLNCFGYSVCNASTL